MEKLLKKDFQIIFEKIERFNNEDTSIKDNLTNETDLHEDQIIRVFGEICKEISNDSKSSSTAFMTFS